MKSPVHEHSGCCLCRRDFLQTMATAAGTAALLSSGAVTLTPAGEASRRGEIARPGAGRFLPTLPELCARKGTIAGPGPASTPRGIRNNTRPRSKRSRNASGCGFKWTRNPWIARTASLASSGR